MIILISHKHQRSDGVAWVTPYNTKIWFRQVKEVRSVLSHLLKVFMVLANFQRFKISVPVDLFPDSP